MAFGIAFENGIRYDGRTGGEAHKPRTDRMEKEFKLETAPYSGMAENGMICYKGVVFTCDTENNRIFGRYDRSEEMYQYSAGGRRKSAGQQRQSGRAFQGDRNVFAGGCQAHYAGNRTGYKGTADAKGTGR